MPTSAVMVYVIPKEKLPQAVKQKQNYVENEKNLYEAMKVFVKYSQVLGVLPQEHMGNLKKMRFQWKSFSTAYTLCMIAAFSFSLGCSYVAWMTKRCTFDGIVTHVTYLGSLATLVLHLRLANHWPELMAAWCKMDEAMNKNYADWTLALVSRCDSVLFKYKGQYTYDMYYKELFPEMFAILPVNYFTGTLCSIKPESFWIEVREDYNRLTVLCRLLDERISYIILLTFSINVFFILVQVYETVNLLILLVEAYNAHETNVLNSDMVEKLHPDFAQKTPLNPTLVESSFHESIKYIITAAQFFGTMPLYNTTKDVHTMKFRLLGFRTAYCLVNICSYLMAPMMFYAMACSNAVVFVNIARHWANILKEWVHVEKAFRSYKKINSKKRFIRIFSIYSVMSSAKNCTNPEREPGEKFFVLLFPNVYTFMRYNIWSGIVVKVVNLTSTFVWLFSNVILILISVELTSKFDQIVEKIKFNKIADKIFWRSIREDYQKVCSLCMLVEEHISPLILISYMHDIFFLCMQLYNSLRERTEVIETVYFFYSFGFIVMRLLSLTLYGAHLNEASKKPIGLLHAISRMIEQMYSHPIGYTGCRLFLVTRNLLLKVLVLSVQLLKKLSRILFPKCPPGMVLATSHTVIFLLT
nr:unnamed protein product [Callosobruchus analis]